MKNIPLFTSEYGVATLILEEIPTKQTGFVIVRTASDMAKLLEDGRTFCRMCGAETVYATAEEPLSGHQAAYEILEFSAKKNQLPAPQGDLKLVAVDDSNAPLFLATYDQIFIQQVGIGAPKLEDGTGYLAYQKEKLVGIGQISPGRLEAIGTLTRGMGYDIATSLLDEIPQEVTTLQVCSLNKIAIKLYKKLGFQKNSTIASYIRL